MDDARKMDFSKLSAEIKKVGAPIKYDGLLLPPFPGLYPDSERKFQERSKMECRDSDVFLCSYPKAGTNWTHEVLSMLLTQKAQYSSVKPEESFLELHASLEIIDNLESPRLFMTHLPYRYLPEQLREGKGKIVYVQRNPKDLFVSFYNFKKGKGITGQVSTWEDFFEKTILGQEGHLYGDWYQYTKDWENELDKENVFTVYFENMKKDLQRATLEMAKFLKIPCSEELAQDISEKCNFENLKNNRRDPTALVSDDKKPSLFRKGQVGDWKNWFTVSQNERFDAYYKDVMKTSKLQFVYQL